MTARFEYRPTQVEGVYCRFCNKVFPKGTMMYYKYIITNQGTHVFICDGCVDDLAADRAQKRKKI